MAPDPAQTQQVSPQEVLASLTKMRSFRLEGSISSEAHLLSQTKLTGTAVKLHRSRLGGMMVYTTDKDGGLNLSLVAHDGQVHSKADLGKSESEVSARILALEGSSHWIIKACFNGEISCTPFRTENGKYVRGKAAVLPEPKGFASALGFEPYQQKLAIGMYGGDIHIVDLANKQSKPHKLHGIPKHDLISALDFSPACEQLAVAADQKLYLVAQIQESGRNATHNANKPLASWNAPGIISSVSFSPWDSLIAVGVGNSVRVLKIEQIDGQHTLREVAHYNVGSFVSSVRFNHHGTEIWFGTGDGRVGVLAQNKPRVLPAAA